MATVAPPNPAPPVQPPVQLALAWYPEFPVPASSPPAPAPSALSRRLRAARDAGLGCDVCFVTASGARVHAHRFLLQRSALRLRPAGEVPVEAAGDKEADAEAALLRAVERHYADDVSDAARDEVPVVAAGLDAAAVPVEEPLLAALQRALDGFGPDLRLLAADGSRGGHEALLGDPDAEAGNYFSGALRFNAAREVKVDECPLEILDWLLAARYGLQRPDPSSLLEARHYAHLFDWADVVAKVDARIEETLKQAGGDSASAVLLTPGMSPAVAHLALRTALRDFEAFESSASAGILPAARVAELRVLCDVFKKDGALCMSLEEYLGACADDLLQWEERVHSATPLDNLWKLHQSWAFWDRCLLAHSALTSPDAATAWRSRVSEKREQFRAARATARAAELRLQPHQQFFEPLFDWREVPAGAVCPAGLEYRLDMSSGRNYARRLPGTTSRPVAVYRSP